MTSSNSPATVTALVDSLRYDPFYVKITEEFVHNEARRRQALARYFRYSMSEGARMGRLVVWLSMGNGGCEFYRRRRPWNVPQCGASLSALKAATVTW